jgi:uncharacterized RDD family membrane protein YckC
MKCPSCGYVSFQNTDECVKCGAPASASGKDSDRAARRKGRDQLGFAFPAESEPALETAVETQATVSAPRAAPRKKLADTTVRETAKTRTDTGDAWAVGADSGDDSSYESGTHWEDDAATGGNTWVEVYRLASGFGRRAGAFAIDGAFFVVLFGMLFYVLRTSSPESSLLNLTYIPAYLFLLVLNAFYFSFFHATTGQTPGKMLTGIRVVSIRGGTLLTPWDSFMRWLGYFLSGIPLGLGFLWSVIDHDDRAWHDRWAKSVVVVVESAATPEAPVEGPPAI